MFSKCSTNSSDLSYFKLCIYDLCLFLSCLDANDQGICTMLVCECPCHRTFESQKQTYWHGSLLETTNGFLMGLQSPDLFVLSLCLLGYLVRPSQISLQERTSDFGWLQCLVIVINLYTDVLPHKLIVQTQYQTSPNHN